MRLMSRMVQDLKDEEGHRGKTLTFQELLAQYDLYPEIIRNWTEHYGDDADFRQSVSVIKNILEGRIVSGALRGNLDSFMATFNLKNNYGWKDDPDAARRDESRLQLEVTELRVKLSDEYRDALPEHANSSHGQTA